MLPFGDWLSKRGASFAVRTGVNSLAVYPLEIIKASYRVNVVVSLLGPPFRRQIFLNRINILEPVFDDGLHDVFFCDGYRCNEDCRDVAHTIGDR